MNVDERQNRTVDPVFDRSVGAYLHSVPAAFAVSHLRFLHNEGFDDVGDLSVERWNVDVRFDVVQGAANIRREHVQDAPRFRREAADTPFGVEYENRDVDDREKVDEITVDLVRFLVAIPELFVDRRQLFVGRLKLLFRRFELFVHALQLFVSRDELFVRRAEIVGRPHVLVDEELQILLGCRELVLQLGNAQIAGERLRRAAGRCGRRDVGQHVGVRHEARGVLEEDEVEWLSHLGQAGERDDDDVAGGANAGVEFDAVLAGRDHFLSRPRDRRAQRAEQATACHLDEVVLRLARGCLQVSAGLSGKMHDLQAFVDEHPRWCVA